ncbi:MAG: zinc ribbon domain-containing protein [Verrucomicrobiae bacterium]|nr:zinc ribbon domain-containing protein [Verrucomicrobiae bacterium]
MPTYEYACQKCGHQFEQFQLISAKSLSRCPKPRCKGKVKRLLSTGGGLIFKGSGFYTTDYRSSGYKEAAKKDSQASSPATKSESKTESKPAAKPAPTTTKSPTNS